jgi:hypothetical protein
MQLPPLAELLRTTPCGQQRTATYKQFVFLFPQYAVKGPFNQEQVTRILERSVTFRKWQTPLILHPLGTASNAEGHWLVFDNLLKGRENECRYEVVSEKFSSYTYRYYTSGPLVVLNKLREQGGTFVPTAELLLALVHCYLLGVGDMGMRNILAQRNHDGTSLYVSDYDENSDNKSFGPMFYFKHIPGKDHKWEQGIQSFYPLVLQELAKIRDMLTPTQVPKYEQVLSILAAANEKRYGVFRGIFTSTTASGHPFDVMKSALQKYIRRGDQKALPVFCEMWALSYLDVSIRTNIYNRLTVIACEDIGIANPPLVHLVLKYKGSDFGTCYTLVEMMIASPKTRVLSHLYFCYSRPLRLQNHVSPRRELTVEEQGWLQGRSSHWILQHYLETSSFLAFTWLYSILTHSKGAKTPKTYAKSSTTDPAAHAWQIIGACTPPALVPIMTLLETCFYKQTNSRRVFILHAALLLMTKSHYSINDYEKVYFLNKVEESNFIPLRQPVLLDEYVVDKHTRSGREQGAGTKQFVEDGAIVHNEDQRYAFPELQFHYTYSRIDVEAEEEKEE